MAEQIFEADPLNIKKEIDEELLQLEKTFDSKLEELYKSATASVSVPSPKKEFVIKTSADPIKTDETRLPEARPNPDEVINHTKYEENVPETIPNDHNVINHTKCEPPSPTKLCSTSLVDESFRTQTDSGVVVESGKENIDLIESVDIKIEPASPQISPVKSNPGSSLDIDLPLNKEEIKDEFDSDYELFEINQENDCFESDSEDSGNPSLTLESNFINDSINVTTEQSISQIEITVSIANKQTNPRHRKRRQRPEVFAANKKSNLSESPQLQNNSDEPLGVLLNLVDPKKWKSKSSLNNHEAQKNTNNKRNSRKNYRLSMQESNKTTSFNSDDSVKKLRSGKNSETFLEEPTSEVRKQNARASNRLGKRKRKCIGSSVEDETVSKRTTRRNTFANKKECEPARLYLIKDPIEANVKSILKRSSSYDNVEKEGRPPKRKKVCFTGIEPGNDFCDKEVISDNDDCLGFPEANTSAAFNNLPDLVKDSCLAVQSILPLVNKSTVSESPSDLTKLSDNITNSTKANNEYSSNIKNKSTNYFEVRINDKQAVLPDNNDNTRKRKLSESSESNEIDVKLGVKSKVVKRKRPVKLRTAKGNLKVTSKESVIEPNVIQNKQNSDLEVDSRESLVTLKVTSAEQNETRKKNVVEPKIRRRGALVESKITGTETRQKQKVVLAVTKEVPEPSRQKHKDNSNKNCEETVVEPSVIKKRQKYESTPCTKDPEVEISVNNKRGIKVNSAIPSKELEVMYEDETKPHNNKSELALKNIPKKYAFAKKSTGPVPKIAEPNQTVDESLPEYSDKTPPNLSENAKIVKKGYARKSTGPVPINDLPPNPVSSNAKVKVPVLAYLCICGEWCKTGELLSGHLKDCKKLQPKIFIPKVRSLT